jgi:hypothetical protein
LIDSIAFVVPDDPADLHVVVQERYELGPRRPPELDHCRVPVTPLLGELVEPGERGGLGRCGVDRP